MTGSECVTSPEEAADGGRGVIVETSKCSTYSEYARQQGSCRYEWHTNVITKRRRPERKCFVCCKISAFSERLLAKYEGPATPWPCSKFNVLRLSCQSASNIASSSAHFLRAAATRAVRRTAAGLQSTIVAVSPWRRRAIRR